MTPEDVLAFEREWANRRQHTGTKEQAIRDRFGLSAVAYYQRLSAMLDDPAVLPIDPATVGRLRRIRDERGSGRLRRR